MISNLSSSISSPTQNDSPYIVCDNLVKIYKIAHLEVVALQGLDLVVSPGELLGIVGASGSGKSTLLNILGGLDRPSAGRVWVGGNDLLKFSDLALDRYRREKVGFVWQQSSRNLIPYLSALENVELPMTLAGKSGPSKRKHAEALLDAVGLGDRMKHHLSELSGGEQQRVAISVSLANNPQLLLADEPTGEVDEATSLTIYETLKRLNNEFGLTILIVSHDPGIAHHVDRVVAIRDGKTAAETVRQSRSNDKSENGDIQGAEIDEIEEIFFEELTVLDSAGRLQVPKDYLEKFNIRGRVRLEITDNGIMILPVERDESELSAEDVSTELEEERKQRSLRGFLSQKWRERMEKRDTNSD
jgi:ABC-type lipoprotein export system ATPase subunit/bifunctional DNA-binding transcriptional regulator/antitoxin component of YhaV-PrlF toxin-antitoxin module